MRLGKELQVAGLRGRVRVRVRGRGRGRGRGGVELGPRLRLLGLLLCPRDPLFRRAAGALLPLEIGLPLPRRPLLRLAPRLRLPRRLRLQLLDRALRRRRPLLRTARRLTDGLRLSPRPRLRLRPRASLQLGLLPCLRLRSRAHLRLLRPLRLRLLPLRRLRLHTLPRLLLDTRDGELPRRHLLLGLRQRRLRLRLRLHPPHHAVRLLPRQPVLLRRPLRLPERCAPGPRLLLEPLHLRPLRRRPRRRLVRRLRRLRQASLHLLRAHLPSLLLGTAAPLLDVAARHQPLLPWLRGASLGDASLGGWQRPCGHDPALWHALGHSVAADEHALACSRGSSGLQS